jgi:hypothetical protein
LRVWKPGQDLAVEESIIRYEGRAKETTTVPNKPTLTGFKNGWHLKRDLVSAGIGIFLVLNRV